MLQVIFTLDYEIHGNGDGCPYALMVEPTSRLMDLFEEYGAKLTIMADIAEILKFKEYKENIGRDDFHYELIAGQLREAIRRGHDVQLHIHPSYFNANCESGACVQNMSEYDFASLSLERQRQMIKAGKHFLESLLQPVNADYQCCAFRAANWSMSPSPNAIRALIENEIRIDSSVFKYGRRHGVVNFDYSHAPSNLVPWKVDENDICCKNDTGKLVEVPIYSENRWIGAFLTPSRLVRIMLSRAHRLPKFEYKAELTDSPMDWRIQNFLKKLLIPMRKHAWKADFNQCTGRQLIRALKRASNTCQSLASDVPFVLIGHSKLHSRSNEHRLRPFLNHCATNPKLFQFDTLTNSHFGCLEHRNRKFSAVEIKSGERLSSANIFLNKSCNNLVDAKSYVLVTPARNEAGTLEETIESVLKQTVLPSEWVIVSNGCTDQTDSIVQAHSKIHPFIRLEHWEDHSQRNFGSVVFATEAGVRALQCQNYQYLGLMDADLRFGANYFETLIERMSADSSLGLAGGLALDVINGRLIWHRHLLTEVPGAVQLYRRACFESLSRLVPIPEGGWDVIACLEARANGYNTKIFEDLVVEHLKPRNSAEGMRLRRAWKWGRRDYALGYHPVFEFSKCVIRAGEAPALLAAGARWAGFLSGYCGGRKRVVPTYLVSLLRKEQWQRARMLNRGEQVRKSLPSSSAMTGKESQNA